MEYMYAAMLLNKAGTDIDEKSLTKVLEAAGVKVDKAKVTVVVNALKGVDIETVLKEATAVPVTAAPAPSSNGGEAEQKTEEKKEEKEEVKEEQAAEGLGALFG